jgi:hypothetical protein
VLPTLPTATKLIDQLGIRTLQQLRNDVAAGGKSLEILTDSQLSCLEFWEDLTVGWYTG